MGLWSSTLVIQSLTHSEWTKDLSARHSETINSTRHLFSADPWLPRPVVERTDVEGWCVSWRICSCTFLWTLVCMCMACMCVYTCIYVCFWYTRINTHTHTHLSRRVRFSPNSTMGTQDISILKGDISQSEPCSRVQPDHTDSLTATQAGRRPGTSDCGVQHMGIWESGWIWVRKHLSSRSRNLSTGGVNVIWDWCFSKCVSINGVI